MGKRQSADFNDKDWCQEGRRLIQKGSHREAIEALDQAIAKNPDYAEAYFVRGACHYAMGSYSQAGDDLDAAALLGWRDAQFWSKYAICPPEKDSDDDEL